MQRYDFFFRQKVEEGELDEAFAAAEHAIDRSWTDLSMVGVVSGLGVAQQASPNLTVQVQGPGVAYDQSGQRIAIASTQNVNCAVDENALNTAVVTPGNSRWLSVFIEFERALTNPRLDGNATTVYYSRAESYVFNVAAGAESVTPTRPTLRGDQILLADISLAYGQTTIANVNIDTTRRQDAIVITDTPRAIRATTFLGALTQLLGFYNDHADGALDQHDAGDLNYAGGAAWADGTTNPAATIEAQLDKIVTDLNPTTTSASGARKIGMEVGPAWADATTTAAGTLQAFLAALITSLAATTSSNSGAHKLGVDALANWANGTTNPAGILRAVLNKIVTDLAASGADSGAHKLGINALSNWADGSASVAAGVLRTGLEKIITDLAGATGTAKVGSPQRTSPKSLITLIAAGRLDTQLGDVMARLETQRIQRHMHRALSLKMATFTATGDRYALDFAWTPMTSWLTSGAYGIATRITAGSSNDTTFVSRTMALAATAWEESALTAPNNYDIYCAYGEGSYILFGGNKDSSSGAFLQRIAPGVVGASAITPTGMTTTTDAIVDLIWTGTRWIAVGTNGKIITTTTANATGGWGAASSKPAGTPTLTALAHSTSLTRTVCVMSGAIWYSSNHGVDWTAAGGTVAHTWKAVAWDAVNQVFIAGGDRVATSADGITWSYAAIDSTIENYAAEITGVAVDEAGIALLVGHQTPQYEGFLFATPDGGATGAMTQLLPDDNVRGDLGANVAATRHTARYVGGRFFVTASVGRYYVSETIAGDRQF